MVPDIRVRGSLVQGTGRAIRGAQEAEQQLQVVRRRRGGAALVLVELNGRFANEYVAFLQTRRDELSDGWLRTTAAFSMDVVTVQKEYQ